MQHSVSKYGAEVIDLVVVGQDRNVSNDYSEDIVKLANTHSLNVVLRTENWDIKSEYTIAVSWRWMIPVKEGHTELIVLHDSLLPKYRGFAPLVNQLIRGETTIGVTAFFANDEVDKGDIIEQQKVGISYPIKVESAIEKLLPLYGDICINIIDQIKGGLQLKGIPQEEKEATYSLWRDEEDYFIDWKNDARYIQRFIDAVGLPYKGAASRLQGRVVRIYDAEIASDLVIMNRDPGKILMAKEDHILVVCETGILKIIQGVYEDTGESILPLKKLRQRFA